MLFAMQQEIDGMYERDSVLKTKLVVTFLGIVIAMPNRSFSQNFRSGHNTQSLPAPTTLGGSAESKALADVVDVASATPQGPRELLQEYEAGMASVTQQFSAKTAAIAEAVQRGELSSDQGGSIASEQYQLAEMQFTLLSVLRETLEQDIARADAASHTQPAPQPQQSGIVMVALPFSSLQLSSSLIQYLSLSPYQVTSIEKIMSDEQHNLAPLMAQMQTTREQLLSITENGQTKDAKEVKVLATNQARSLAKLIVANSQMRTKIYQLLSPTQQKKLDEIQHQ